ncbi:restriction endonuclease [Streptomyces sp. NPDC028635]|uniref:restriction endonuclease n=1 Tax=Streptomyces sp. NPDC028635 TaxID=3154800 RepID=UPI0033FC0AE4
MTTPARRIRGTGRRRFDLRATAVYFGLLALVVCALGFVVRTVIAAAARRPVWQAALCLVAVSALLALGRRRRRTTAARTARRAAAALEAATDTALEALETPAAQSPLVPGQAGGSLPPAGAGDVLPRPRAGETLPHPEAGETLPRESPVDYDALDADEFEQAVAALCERDGCTGVEVVGGAGDLGADVLAVTPDGRRMVIQCKHYSGEHRVGSQDLQRFGGTCYTVHEADVAVLVTTSDFTAPAAEYADQCGILCVDRSALHAWSDGSGPAPWVLVGFAAADDDVIC